MALVVDHQHHGFEPPFRSSQRCRIPSFTNLTHKTNQTGLDLSLDLTKERKNFDGYFHVSGEKSIKHGNIHRSSSSPCFTMTTRVEQAESSKSARVELISGQSAPRVRALTAEVAVAIAAGANTVPSSSGLGGAYFLSNQNGDEIAVAKPIDEEPLALNNPKGFTGKVLGQPGLKRSIRVGEAGIRELAAYLLDHGGFAGVPPTALVKFSNVAFHTNKSTLIATPPYKIASLQRYVEHESDAGDLGPCCFSVSSVHRIGILDVRLMNIDRHSGNILVKKSKNEKYTLDDGTELIPIDHGLSLPEWLDDPYFEWLHWPQASRPFSEEEMEYIKKLDPFGDGNLLRSQIPCLSESAIRVLIVCTIFLKRATSAGLCLGDIGEMMTRDNHGGGETMSILEDICAKAKNTVSLLNNDVQVFEFDEDYEKSFKEICESFMWKPPLAPKRGLPIKYVNKLDLISEDNFQQIDRGVTKKWTQVVEMKGKDTQKMGKLVKSISIAPPSRKNELEGISFGEMNEEEWEFFLDIFENLLPQVFEDRKRIGVLQRADSA